jgi:hypothetical protein
MGLIPSPSKIILELAVKIPIAVVAPVIPVVEHPAIPGFLGEDLSLVVHADQEILVAQPEAGLGNKAFLDLAAEIAAQFKNTDRVSASVQTIQGDRSSIGNETSAIDHDLKVFAAVEDHSGPAIGSK